MHYICVMIKPPFLIFGVWIWVFAGILNLPAQSPKGQSQRFELLRKNPDSLRLFFQAMPKGGELHHHYSGAIPANLYFSFARKAGMGLDTMSWKWYPADSLKSHKLTPVRSWKSSLQTEIQEKLNTRWTVKGYAASGLSSEDFFFHVFTEFDPLTGPEFWPMGFRYLLNEARDQKINYRETILIEPTHSVSAPSEWNSEIRNLILKKDTNALNKKLRQVILSGMLNKAQIPGLDLIDTLMPNLENEFPDQTLRLQFYVVRVREPFDFFIRLAKSFEIAKQNKYFVNVNLVAPEDNPIALKDYGLHLWMYHFCQVYYSGLSASVHAGEITQNEVDPSQLGWHISSLIERVHPQRIGHGVDVPLGEKGDSLLLALSNLRTAVEINLSSNKFILGVSGNNHPFMRYIKARVPLVISTDDPAILETNLIKEFIFLTQTYPDVGYLDIREMIVNSLEFSFLREPELLKKRKQELIHALTAFESNWLK